MSDDLADLMTRALAAVTVEPDAGDQIIRRYRRSHRRRLAAGAAALAVAVAAAVAIPLLTETGSDTGVQRIVPANVPTPSVPSLGNVFGVDVTYIPQGLHFVGEGTLDTGTYEPPETPGGTTVTGSFASSVPQNTLPDVTVVVQRGAAADLDRLAKDAKLTIRWTTVNGHRALLRQRYTADPNTQQPSTDSYLIEWVEPGNVTVSVGVHHGPDPAAEAQRVADGLVVGAQTQPANRPAAIAQIRNAALNAFTLGKPAATVLGALEGGQQLAPVLAELKRDYPGLAASVRVTHVGNVFFFDANHAFVDATYSYEFHGQAGSGGGVDVVDTGEGWKVSQASFCAAVYLVACPPK